MLWYLRYVSYLLDENVPVHNNQLKSCCSVAVRPRHSRDWSLETGSADPVKKNCDIKGKTNAETAGVIPPQSHRSRRNVQVPLSKLHLETQHFPTPFVPTEFRRTECSPSISLLLACFTDVQPIPTWSFCFCFSLNFLVIFVTVLADAIRDVGVNNLED